MDYKPRIVDSILSGLLSSTGVVAIEGPKGCGKKTTGLQIAQSHLDLSRPEELNSTVDLVNYNPHAVLSGSSPRLITEWLKISQLRNEVHCGINDRQKTGQFILTSSVIPKNRSEIFESETGLTRLRMHTMSLFESGESNGSVSLSELFDGHTEIGSQNSLEIEALVHAACRGGWPDAVVNASSNTTAAAGDHLDVILNTDYSCVDGERKDAGKARALMRAYANHIGSTTSAAFICREIKSLTGVSFSLKTCQKYLTALNAVFLVEDVPSWHPCLRRQTAIRASDARYFADPSICAAALQVEPKNLLTDPKAFGLVFKNLCMRDLRVYAQALNGSIFHYRDKNGLTCDAVLHRKNGSYGLIEIKLGGKEAIDDGAKMLIRLARKIDTAKIPAPAFSMVLTAAGTFAYRRPDGILVVPIGCLRP